MHGWLTCSGVMRVAGSPGHAAGVTHPAMLLFVVAAAALAGVELTVQTLAFAVDQEFERLQAADAVGVRQVGLGAQQLTFGVLFVNLCLQLSATKIYESAINSICI